LGFLNNFGFGTSTQPSISVTVIQLHIKDAMCQAKSRVGMLVGHSLVKR